MGEGGQRDKVLTFDAESKSVITKFPYVQGRGQRDKLPTFDAECKSAKIQKIL